MNHSVTYSPDEIERQLDELIIRADQALASSLTLVARASAEASALLGFVYESPIPAGSQEDVGCIPFAQHLPELGEDGSQNTP